MHWIQDSGNIVFVCFLSSQGEGGAPGLPGIAGPRGGPVSVKDIFQYIF
jgi:hypothetical protein